jgi:hypothetical protein
MRLCGCGASARRVTQNGRCFITSLSTQRDERCSDEHDVIDRRPVVFFEVAEQPACGDTLVPMWFALGNQDRQFEGLFERDPPNLVRGRFSNEQVAAFERPAENRPGRPLRGQADNSSPGPERSA